MNPCLLLVVASQGPSIAILWSTPACLQAQHLQNAVEPHTGVSTGMSAKHMGLKSRSTDMASQGTSGSSSRSPRSHDLLLALPPPATEDTTGSISGSVTAGLTPARGSSIDDSLPAVAPLHTPSPTPIVASPRQTSPELTPSPQSPATCNASFPTGAPHGSNSLFPNRQATSALTITSPPMLAGVASPSGDGKARPWFRMFANHSPTPEDVVQGADAADPGSPAVFNDDGKRRRTVQVPTREGLAPRWLQGLDKKTWR
jgi:hypothetical protein